MPGKRKLIVVANRGPVAYGAVGGQADHEARRRRALTALRSLVAQHDVTWIGSAMSGEDRAVAAEHGGDGFDETFTTARRIACGSSPTTRWRYGGSSNVVANPTLWFIQHYMWGLADEPDLDAAFRQDGRRLCRGERGVRGGGCR